MVIILVSKANDASSILASPGSPRPSGHLSRPSLSFPSFHSSLELGSVSLVLLGLILILDYERSLSCH